MNSDSANVRPLMIVSDPEKIRILLNETRLKIVKHMKNGIVRDNKLENDFMISDIAEMLGLKVHNLYHHIDVLLEHGFIEKSREVKKKRSVIAFYRRTANGYLISYDDEEIDVLAEKNKEFISGTLKLFDIGLADEALVKLIELYNKLQRIETKKLEELNTKIGSSSQLEFNLFYHLRFLASILISKDEEAQAIFTELGNILLPYLE